jgi:hypothetical protein
MASEREVELSGMSAQLKDAEEGIREYRHKMLSYQESMD